MRPSASVGALLGFGLCPLCQLTEGKQIRDQGYAIGQHHRETANFDLANVRLFVCYVQAHRR